MLKKENIEPLDKHIRTSLLKCPRCLNTRLFKVTMPDLRVIVSNDGDVQVPPEKRKYIRENIDKIFDTGYGRARPLEQCYVAHQLRVNMVKIFVECSVCGSIPEAFPEALPSPKTCSCDYGCNHCETIKDPEGFFGECVACVAEHVLRGDSDPQETICANCPKEAVRVMHVPFKEIKEAALNEVLKLW
jgi:hypothetical protein